MNGRKIIQVAHSAGGVLWALCDDGSVWGSLSEQGAFWNREWKLLPGIPQD